MTVLSHYIRCKGRWTLFVSILSLINAATRQIRTGTWYSSAKNNCNSNAQYQFQVCTSTAEYYNKKTSLAVGQMNIGNRGKDILVILESAEWMSFAEKGSVCVYFWVFEGF